jgi:general secretion pathway protein F
VPVFAYRGLTADGRNVRGVLDADSARTARARLRRDGVFPTDVAEETRGALSGRARSLTVTGRVRPTDLAIVTRQLATLIAAGLPVVEALAAVCEQTDRPQLARALSQVRERVTQGSPLAEAMEEHAALFPPLYTGMVRVGESAGALDVVLERLAVYTEAQARLRSKVRTALAYPLLMSIVAIGILTFLLGFVVPKVTRIFEEQHQALPLPTRILLGISAAVADYWWVAVGLVAVGIVAAILAMRRPAYRLWLDRRILILPVAGPVITRVAVARFARTLATLLQSGIPLLSALEVAGGVIANRALVAAVEDARQAIREGQSIAPPLRRAGIFPPLLIHMVAVGERSGELESMLGKVADAYEQEVESILATLTAVLEPAMIVLMGGIVLFIVLAILLPIFEINSLVR